jgi:hypothetical protein
MTSGWRFTDHTAIGTTRTGRILVNPWDPTHFVQLQNLQAAQFWQACAIQPLPHHSLQPEEIYVREQDLIARYGQTAQDTFAFQLNWRLLPAQAQFEVALEVWISVQTNLLDSNPIFELSTTSPAGGVWERWQCDQITDEISQEPRSTATPMALACRGTDQANVWLFEPFDQRQLQFKSQPSDSIQRVDFLGHFLEKGVIRRARLRFLFSERSASPEDILRAYQSFRSSPLPLTA